MCRESFPGVATRILSISNKDFLTSNETRVIPCDKIVKLGPIWSNLMSWNICAPTPEPLGRTPSAPAIRRLGSLRFVSQKKKKKIYTLCKNVPSSALCRDVSSFNWWVFCELTSVKSVKIIHNAVPVRQRTVNSGYSRPEHVHVTASVLHRPTPRPTPRPTSIMRALSPSVAHSIRFQRAANSTSVQHPWSQGSSERVVIFQVTPWTSDDIDDVRSSYNEADATSVHHHRRQGSSERVVTSPGHTMNPWQLWWLQLFL
jgi:hypothetical protein